MSRPLAFAHELTACVRMNSRPRTTPRSEPVADECARRGPQEEHAGDVVNRVHRFALLAQIHTCPRLPAILVDLKQYVAVSIGRASQHKNRSWDSERSLEAFRRERRRLARVACELCAGLRVRRPQLPSDVSRVG